MRCKKLWTCLFSTTAIVPALPLFSISSCAKKHIEVGNIDGTNWEGVSAGNFLNTDYQIDLKTQTITYISGIGIHAYNLIVPNYVMFNGVKLKVQFGARCFKRCQGLSGSVQFNEFIYDIPDECFMGCTSLVSVIFVNKPRYIGNLSFAECPLLTGIFVIDRDHLDSDWSSNLKSIGNFAFSRCFALAGDLTLGPELTSLGEFCFNSCTSLTSVNLEFCTNLTQINVGAFSGCIDIYKVKAPPYLYAICDEAFRGCTQLRSIELPRYNMSITLGDFALCGCEYFYNFSKNPTIESIGEGCFSLDVNLSIRPWESKYELQNIPANAFASCGLTSIAFEPSLPNVENYAFSYNGDLNYLDFSAFGPDDSVPQWTGQHIFVGCYDSGTILFKNEGMFSDEWRDFFERNDIEIENGKWEIHVL